MKLIIGLGNPGKEYEKTRHNIGFMCVDNYVDNNLWKEKFNALYLEMMIDGEKVLFIKPLTYMNLSGQAVKCFVDYFKIDIVDILVIQDDLDLPVGQIRLKVNSSAGGHNGIKSIINEIGNENFARLKIGIANNKNYETKDYVLGKFNEEEDKLIKDAIIKTKEIINYFLKNGIEKSMNRYNSRWFYGFFKRDF